MLLLDLHIMTMNVIMEIGNILTVLLQPKNPRRRRRLKNMEEFNNLHFLMTLQAPLILAGPMRVTRSKTISQGMEE
uniref:Uncharacterized protein n=1 Tax=Lotus japonicus TaxID=34305 RepID=I3S1K2_LOTJA|nr:unknown [Lotus japonicus]